MTDLIQFLISIVIGFISTLFFIKCFSVKNNPERDLAIKELNSIIEEINLQRKSYEQRKGENHE